jgi:tRNA (guanine-N7-)-methyltransferase
LNFSDPWPKKRHARRRLTHERFLRAYWEALKPNGEIHFKTDSETLFEFSLNEFSASPFELKQISLNLHRDGSPEWNVMTEYETKFSMRGQPIFRLEAEKKTHNTWRVDVN